MKSTKEIKNYEELYSINKNGDVYSIKNGRCRKLKTNIYTGYSVVFLCKNGKVKIHCIHRLLYENYKGYLIDGMQINHIDGNKLNNELSNLEQITPKQNTNHAYKIGLKKVEYGLKAGGRLLFEEVLEIRKLYNSGVSQTELSKLFKTHQTNIHYIVSGKTRVYA